ncbi:MAG: DUF411 domain-containing protein, partial [Thermodesulfobacteriota bacterium]
MIKRLNTIVLGLLLTFFIASSVSASEIKMYKSPYCGCCTNWAEVLEKDGFTISSEKRSDM